MTRITISIELKDASTESYSLRLNSCSLPEIEAMVIREVLAGKDWNLSQAAEVLGIARGTLYSKIKSHNIER